MAGQHDTSGIDVNAEGFQRSLIAALERMKVKGEADLSRVAIQVSNRAKQLCPVATGRLRASINAQPLLRDTKGAYVEIGVMGKDIVDGGTPVNYAFFVEYGTSTASAQPFLRPALAEVSGQFHSGPPS